jgi:ABC-2 type transport system ATP-binding protein
MPNPFLQIKKISKVYLDKKRTKKAVDEISFDLYESEIIGLLGVNGAGKTTLSSIIATLIKPTSGDILFNDISVYKQLVKYRKNIGLCPQKPNLDRSLTLEENLYFSGRFYGLSKKETTMRHDELIEWFHLAEYKEAKVDQLSGGYKQRFLIARALMHSPKMVILDEPTVGLDPHIRRQLWKVISTLKEKKISVILTTHYLDEAQMLSDRVIMIHSGKLKLIDTPQQLMSQYNKANLEDVFLQLQEEEG